MLSLLLCAGVGADVGWGINFGLCASLCMHVYVWVYSCACPERLAGWLGGWVRGCPWVSVKQVTQLRVLSPKETFFLVESVAKARGGRAGEGQSLGGIMPLTAPVVRNVLGRLKGEK